MSFSFAFSPFNSAPDVRRFVDESLRGFASSPLSFRLGKKEREEAAPLVERLKPGPPLFVFAFGGAGCVSRFLRAFFPNACVCLVDSLNKRSAAFLRDMPLSKLKAARFLFISRSGQTEEILFFQRLLQRICKKNRLSFKNRLLALTRFPQSPLGRWAKRSEGFVVPLKGLLPGRFSFFDLSGFLQAKAFGLKFEAKALGYDKQAQPLAEFFIHHRRRKEIFVCPLDPLWHEAAQWLSLSYSESLFKETLRSTPPAMKTVAFSDLRHGLVEELMFKKKQALFLALGRESALGGGAKSRNETKIKNLLQKRRIPFLFVRPGLAPSSFFRFPALFYKLVFCMGAFYRADIYSQFYVDYLKGKGS